MPRFIQNNPRWLLLALWVALPLEAREPNAPQGSASEDPPISLSLAIGAAQVPDYEGSDDYKLLPVPHLGIDNINGRETYIRFSGRLDSNIIDHPHWRFGLSAYYLSDYRDKDDNQFEEIDDDLVSLLLDTEDALQTGLTLGYDFSADPRSQYLMEVTATYDVMHGNGGIVTPRFRMVRFLSSRLIFSSAVSASWASDQHMQNRFGISDADAVRSGLTVYTAGSGVKNFAAEASLTWIVNRTWTATLFSRYQHITGDAADSPIVNNRGDTGNQVLGALVSRRFQL